jgi:tyrosinase
LSADGTSTIWSRGNSPLHTLELALTASRLALNGTFTIYYFIGPFDNANESSWNLTPTLAGTSHNFAAPVEQCDNCGRQDQQGLLVTDTTPITPMLMDYVLKGNLEDLTPEKVEPFLVKNLRWRILKVCLRLRLE